MAESTQNFSRLFVYYQSMWQALLQGLDMYLVVDKTSTVPDIIELRVQLGRQKLN